MQSTLIAGALCALLLPFSAQAAKQQYKVVDSRIDYGASTSIVDINGKYGEAGRSLRVVNLKATALSGELTEDTALGPEYGEIDGTINYRLTYSLLDTASGNIVASEQADASFRLLVMGDPLDTYKAYNGRGGLIDAGGSIFGEPAPCEWDCERAFWGAGYSVPNWQVGRATWVGSTIVLTGEDRYRHSFSLAPEFGGHRISAVARGYVHLQPVPEPETYALMALGLGAVVVARRRRV